MPQPLERLPAPSLPAWIERQLPKVPDSPSGGFERFRVRVDGRHLHVMTAGPVDAPPVLLLHGNPTWSFLWRKVAAELLDPPSSLRLIMPDLVGLGFSDNPRDPSIHTLENHARWIGGVIDGLALDELVLVLHDWGGPIGTLAMADRRDRLAGLVVLNTVASPPKAGFRQTAFHRFACMPVVSTFAFRVFGFPQRALHRVQGDPSSIRGEVARAYRYPLRGWARNAAPLALARMVPDAFEHASIPGLERCRELVEGFDGSAAIVWGDRDPILGRVRRWMESLLPQAEVTRTEAGHFLQEEVPAEIAGAIRAVAAKAF